MMTKIRGVSSLVKFFQFLVGLSLGYYLPLLLPNSNPYITQHDTQITLPATHQTSSELLPIFVGVMTAHKYLNTRACSVWRSWAQEVVELGGEVRFFVGEGGEGGGEWCGLPLVILRGVEDSAYPPQRKSFLMLSWMNEHIGQKARWFLRADDDVFVKVEPLIDFLRSINHSEPHYIGQAGRGRGQEEGRLGLDWNQNFCMGGPGVVLSRTTLRLLSRHIPHCLQHLMTDHEDVELGRCVNLATGRSCTWSYDMQSLFYHSSGHKPGEERGSEVVPSQVGERVLQHALTLHPLKDPANMEAMASWVAANKRNDLLSEAQNIRSLEARTGLEQQKELSPSQVEEANMLDLTQLSGDWDLILNHQLYSLKAGGARRKVPDHLAEGLTRVVGRVLDLINNEASEKGRVIEFRDLFYAYVHTDPVHGLTYILDLLLLYKRYKGNKMTVKVRRHVYVRQPLLSARVKLEVVPDLAETAVLVSGDGVGGASVGPGQTDRREMVTLVVPIAGQTKLGALSKFLDNYEQEVLTVLQPVRLVVVVFTEEGKEGQLVEHRVREGIEALESSYPGYSFTVTVLRNQSFNRAAGLMAGVAECETEDLLLLLDIDIKFSVLALDTVRRFTRRGHQVYFPIVFSQFKNGVGQELSSKTGYWRDFGFGIMAAYKSDLLLVDGLNTSITGWGKEDVDLYDRFITSNLTVFRAPSPDLVHRFHPVVCSPDLAPDQAAMCGSSKANTFLSLSDLADRVLNSSLLHN